MKRLSKIEIKESEFLDVKILGVHLKYDPRFKLIKEANRLGLQGFEVKEIVSEDTWRTDEQNNTFDRAVEYSFLGEPATANSEGE